MTRGYEHVKASDLRQKGAPTAAKPLKYRNVRYEAEGEKFDSKAEYATWHELKLREKAGEIRNLQRQVPFSLLAPNSDRTGYVEIATYIADFTFDEQDGAILCEGGFAVDRWVRVVADRKGGRNTAIFSLKKKWLELQTGIQIREIR